ncbi:hypothetical protein [Leifsonia sp. P73]|uniref:hypothetical protein n=1 Tax=Leifsonia sp. P73 TaxID=3423959 RepID=UPI003DA6298B
MVLNRVDEFETRGRRFTLYEGGSLVLFEEDGDGAEGIGTIVRSDTGFVVTAWWKPGLTIIVPTLPEAVNRLVEIAIDTHSAPDDHFAETSST